MNTFLYKRKQHGFQIGFPALLLLFILIASMAGCSTTSFKKAIHARAVDDYPNSYYYYLEAHLQKNKHNIDGAIYNLKKAIDLKPESSYLKQELAVFYILHKEQSKAVKIIEEVLEIEPDNIDALNIYARIKHSLKQTDSAKVTYQKILKLDPTRRSVYLLVGGLYIEEKNYDEALDVYKRLIEHFPESYPGYFFIGKIYTQQKKYKKAIQAYQQALSLEPELEEPRFEMIKLYKELYGKTRLVAVNKGDNLSLICRENYKKCDEEQKQILLNYNPHITHPDKIDDSGFIWIPEARLLHSENARGDRDKLIVDLYQEILKNNSRNLRASFGLALFWHSIGNVIPAEEILSKLGAESELNWRHILQYVVRHYIEPKRLNEALILLKGMLDANPNQSEINYLIGVAADGLGKNKTAVRYFLKVLPTSDFYPNAVIHTAYVYQKAKRLPKAIELLESVQNKLPDNTEILLYLGSFYEEIKAYHKAQEVLLKGIKIDAKNTKLHFRLGIVYDKLDRKELSIEEMKKVILLDSEHASALNYLGYTYADLGRNLDEAEEMIKKALKAMPQDGYVTDSLGWVYFQKGKFPEALKVLKKAANLVKDDPIILEHVGDAYLKNDNAKSALDYYKRSLKVRKKDRSAIEEKIFKLKQSPNDS